MARTLLAAALPLGRGTQAEKKDNKEKDISGQFSVFLVWLDALKWTGKKIQNILIYEPNKRFL